MANHADARSLKNLFCRCIVQDQLQPHRLAKTKRNAKLKQQTIACCSYCSVNFCFCRGKRHYALCAAGCQQQASLEKDLLLSSQTVCGLCGSPSQNLKTTPRQPHHHLWVNATSHSRKHEGEVNGLELKSSTDTGASTSPNSVHLESSWIGPVLWLYMHILSNHMPDRVPHQQQI